MPQQIKAIFGRLVQIEVIVRMNSNVFEVPLVQGDTGPRLRFSLLDDTGVPVGVSGAGCGVKLYLHRVQDECHSNLGHESCSAFDVTNALWDYGLQTGDVSATGTYFGDVEITYSDGTVETAPQAVRFLVRENNKL